MIADRTETAPRGLMGLTGYQWACLGLAPVFLGLWVKDAREFRRVETGPAG